MQPIYRFFFDNIDSDKYSKRNIDHKVSLELHTLSNTSTSLTTKIDTLLIKRMHHVHENIMAAKTDFHNFICRNDGTKLHTNLNEDISTNVHKIDGYKNKTRQI